MTIKTLDTIVGSNKTVKADYYFYHIPSAPLPIESLYTKTFNTMYKVYDTTKYLVQYMYNIILRR